MSRDSTPDSQLGRFIAWVRRLLSGDRRPEAPATQVTPGNRPLPDLDAIDAVDSDDVPRESTPTPTDREEADLAEPARHTDFDDAAGAYIGGEDYDTISPDPDEVEHLHHAVRGVDDDDDDATDRTIDTSREVRPGSASTGEEAEVEPDQDVLAPSTSPDLGEREEPSEEDLAARGQPAERLDQADIEAADIGHPASPAVDDSPAEIAHQHAMNDLPEDATAGAPDAAADESDRIPESAVQDVSSAPDEPGDIAGTLPAGAVRGDGSVSVPEGYPVKGIAHSKIFLLPHFPAYASTPADICFATEDDAVAAGFRAPGRRSHAPQGETSGR